MIRPFTDTYSCPTLSGKLQLFLVQACRGSEAQPLVALDGPATAYGGGARRRAASARNTRPANSVREIQKEVDSNTLCCYFPSYSKRAG